MYFWYYLHLIILTLKSSLAKIVNIYLFYQKFVHLGKNTSKHCSRIIAVHVHATGLESPTNLEKYGRPVKSEGYVLPNYLEVIKSHLCCRPY